MVNSDNTIVGARVHHSANNQRLVSAILGTSVNKVRKEHHNKGKRFGTPFKKGHSAYSHTPKNPISLIALLRDELSRIPSKETDGFDGQGKSNAWWLIHNYVNEAVLNIDDNPGIVKDVLDRIDGKPAQAIVGPGGGPIQVQEIKIIDDTDIKDAIEALVECKAICFNPN